MLRLENIVKNYQTGKTSFPALKGISLAFRKNEFVSILGPSGCGKTTLLNIIGGLDHYTTGDLVIEGKSTKEYKSRDWDLYRNHRIGFIFQSYNLIPHQNILENVELALTIAGYSKEEKRKKALKALSKVGLKKAWKKMPNQLSGGQCQRVAIARALVNEPDILLGDEPTGALDSKTSVQVMELIKKISRKKLVIMVTHNPPLAEQYSTRIISLLDGEVKKDTNPYKLSEEKKEKFKAVETIRVGSKTVVKADKAKMSFWSAFKLSAKNLISKKKRTAMVIAASSIGIVGVASVLAVSTGVRGFISNTEKDMLSGNPLMAAEESFDLVTMLGSVSSALQRQAVSKSIDGNYIDIEFLTGTLIQQAKQGVMISNTITQDYVDYLDEGKEKNYYIADVYKDYGFDISNNIYTEADIKQIDENDKNKYVYSLSGLKNIYTALLDSIETTPQADFTGLANIAANFPSVMYKGLDNEDYIKEQYDLLKGNWPKKQTDEKTAGTKEKPYECVVVLNRRKKLVDLIVTLAGMLSEEDFMKVIFQFVEDKPNYDIIQKISKIALDKVLGKSFYYIANGKSGHEGAFKENTEGTEKQSRPFIYNYKFKEIINNDKVTDLQTTHSEVGEGSDETTLTIPTQSISGDATSPREIKVVGIIAPKEGRNYGSLTSGIYFQSDLSEQMMKDVGQTEESLEIKESDSALYKTFVNPENWMSSGIAEKMILGLDANQYNSRICFKVEDGKWSPITESLNYGMYYKIGFTRIRGFDKEGKAETNPLRIYGAVGSRSRIIPHTTKTEEGEEVLDFMEVSSSANTRSIAGRKFNDLSATEYSYEKLPYRISIYSRDFDTKEKTKTFLDEWNSDRDVVVKGQTITAKDRSKVIVPDNLSVVIAMINNLITMTTVSLTIFASLSLVVSSVMIGIITYISVMERIKEIGVIRSLGGRKKDVSHLFNAETFILGTAAGVFGIIITYIFELILDITIYATYKIPMIANLKWWTALIMIVLSIVLTAVSGLIPSRSAAKKDPVNALRSE